MWGHFFILEATDRLETPDENEKIVSICLILSLNPAKTIKYNYMAITVTRPPPPVSLGKRAKYGPLYSTIQPRRSPCLTVWSTELCSSVPGTILILLIETAKIFRLSALPILFRVSFFALLCIIYTDWRQKDISLFRRDSIPSVPYCNSCSLFKKKTLPRGTERHSLSVRDRSFFPINATVRRRATPLSVRDRS